jgi:pimeloyl-ACP methyl ester carboxylesterase
MSKKPLVIGLLLVVACTGSAQEPETEEVVFHSGPFKLVGDLELPAGDGPYPVVVFVHGDGPNSRTSGVTYPPIMERMQRAGYATFAWDKPGTGESTGRIDRSRLLEQRSQIVLDAIAFLKQRPDIDAERIGLWGISQAGYVMPRVLDRSDDIAFMIAVSCPGVAGVDQGIFLLAKQMVCAGYPEEKFEYVEGEIRAFTMALTYEDYARHKAPLAADPSFQSLAQYGQRAEIAPKEDWHADDRDGDYYWDPMQVIGRTTIPVLVFFGGKDTQVDPIQGAQAYLAALERAGNTNFRVEIIPGTDHNIILSESGCIEERDRRPRREWTNYAPEYLDILEEWLAKLRGSSSEVGN